jgi:hypothetical protein
MKYNLSDKAKEILLLEKNLKTNHQDNSINNHSSQYHSNDDRLLLSNSENLINVTNKIVNNDNHRIPMDKSSILHSTKSGQLVITGGNCNGLISIKSLNQEYGSILFTAQFTAHRSKVIHISSDVITSSDTDVISTIDITGQIFIWYNNNSII